MQPAPNPSKPPHKRVLIILLVLVTAMIGLSFAAVPLYRLFCQATGLGGTTKDQLAAETRLHELQKPLARQVTIRLDGQVNDGLPWDFKPKKHTVEVHLGEQSMVNYQARNRARNANTGMAVYNVSPPKAGKYFYKLQCFCFTKQTLQPGQKIEMPVTFFVDPDMAKDPTMDDVTTITLSYTFYPANSLALKAAQDKYYSEQGISPPK